MMPGLGGFRNLGLFLKLKSHENISLWVWPIVKFRAVGVILELETEGI